MGKARDIRKGDVVRPKWVTGDVGDGWKVVGVKMVGEDVLVDVEGQGGGVYSLPVLGEDDDVRITR